MKLGTYTFDWLPSKMPPMVPEKRSAAVKTFSGVAYFSWGASIVGKEVQLEWDLMREAQFDSLQALFEADLPVLWDLDVAGHINYMVEITGLDGELLEVVNYDQPFREKVKLALLVLSETSSQGS
jgi:hypothetical protein